MTRGLSHLAFIPKSRIADQPIWEELLALPTSILVILLWYYEVSTYQRWDLLLLLLQVSKCCLFQNITMLATFSNQTIILIHSFSQRASCFKVVVAWLSSASRMVITTGYQIVGMCVLYIYAMFDMHLLNCSIFCWCKPSGVMML
jgi:hypothetical protein